MLGAYKTMTRLSSRAKANTELLQTTRKSDRERERQTTVTTEGAAKNDRYKTLRRSEEMTRHRGNRRKKPE